MEWMSIHITFEINSHIWMKWTNVMQLLNECEKMSRHLIINVLLSSKVWKGWISLHEMDRGSEPECDCQLGYRARSRDDVMVKAGEIQCLWALTNAGATIASGMARWAGRLTSVRARCVLTIPHPTNRCPQFSTLINIWQTAQQTN